MTHIELRHQISALLRSIPPTALADSDAQQAFVAAMSLDRALADQIQVGRPLKQFVELLLSALLSYGALADGRHPLEAALEAAKAYVNVANRARCDALIELVRQHAPELLAFGDEPEPVSALRMAYLNRVLDLCGEVALSGIYRKREIDARLSLGAIYTALLTLQAERGERDGKSRRPDELTKMLERQELRRVSAVAQLNQHKRLVLLGDPGSGKSTFVNFVAICLAGALVENECADLGHLTAPLPDNNGQPEEDRQPWDHGPLLPVRVILRDFAAESLPAEGQPATARHVWQCIGKWLAEAELGEYAEPLREHLRQRGGLMLFDGLDEVPEAHARRAQIKQAVEDFGRSFPKCRILVTSRTYAYQQQQWRLSGFEEAVLAPFTTGQIIRFVEQWYAQSAPLLDMRVDDAAHRANQLKQAIVRSDRLTSLAERPLLLTLMASLHAWRGGSLPERREELYDAAVELLLDWWEIRKVKGQVQSLSEVLHLGREGLKGLRSLIGKLAYEAHAAQPELVGTANLTEDRLAGALMRLSEKTASDPRQIKAYLRERAGLLVSHGVEMYTFPHRTFQEYLAACYLTEDQNNYPDNVAGLARTDPNRWREVALLAGAKAARGAMSTVWDLAEALCWSADIPVGVSVEAAKTPTGMSALPSALHADAWGALLAAQVVVENADVTQVNQRHRPKVERIIRWLVAILTEQVWPKADSRLLSNVEAFPATERALAGNLLAKLGDPRPGVGLRADGLPDIAWCDVPAGPFLMGSDKSQDKGADSDELPQHEVHVPAFQISRYPVTNAQYQAFVQDGGYTEKWRRCWSNDGWNWKGDKTSPRKSGGDFDLPNHPVVYVTWYEATAFCAWLTAKLRAQPDFSDNPIIIRLPSEAEWEKAARSPDGRIYPWGDAITPEFANYDDTGLGATSAVGCFPRGVSPYGCQDMAGNVLEWCQDVWHDNYQGAPDDGSAWEEGENSNYRLWRGGSWHASDPYCRVAYRYGSPRATASTTSFSCGGGVLVEGSSVTLCAVALLLFFLFLSSRGARKIFFEI